MGNSPWNASELGKAGQIIENLWEIYGEIYGKSMGNLCLFWKWGIDIGGYIV